MKRAVLFLSFLGLLLAASTVRAFLDEVASLKSELQEWEVAHAADFSEVVTRLDELSGPVFRDVRGADWFNPYVSSLAEWGIVSGYRDTAGKSTGEFRPGNSVTIAEVLKMAMGAAQIRLEQCATSAPRHAAAAKHWAVQYVACAEEMNVRLFRTGVNIKLDAPAKRAEVLAIVHDVFGDKVLPIYSSYMDTAGHPFEADIAYATLVGIVSGDTDANGNARGSFRPNDPINRAETSKVVYQKVKNKARQEIAAAQ